MEGAAGVVLGLLIFGCQLMAQGSFHNDDRDDFASFVGVDRAEAHYDICVLDETGTVLAKKRIPDRLGGVVALHELRGNYAEEPAKVLFGIAKDRGLIAAALVGQDTGCKLPATGNATSYWGPGVRGRPEVPADRSGKSPFGGHQELPKYDHQLYPSAATQSGHRTGGFLGMGAPRELESKLIPSLRAHGGPHPCCRKGRE